ncbi:alpha/beta fold hydrolase [Rhodopila sp.]|uniref:alpha/beta fold hydrolase n=1 Tax=Rhodopila sp. TaxID=2480087 RepID=UPI003D0B9707
MTPFPPVSSWREACAADASLAAWHGPWSIDFAIASDSETAVFSVLDGKPQPNTAGEPAFTLAAPQAVWRKFLQPIPPRHHHGIFAMHYRVPEFTIQGNQLAFVQHAHIARRVLEIGKWLALGNQPPVPVNLAPRQGPRPAPNSQGGYVPVTIGGITHQIYYETAGTGRDVLCMHTAGSDGRQFHGLMADSRIIDHHRLVAFDMPWHGKSPPPDAAVPGSWRLNTDFYVELIMGFMAAAHLDKPIALGASMSGEICLELAYRHPEAFTGIVACEACEKIERRQTSWAAHPRSTSRCSFRNGSGHSARRKVPPNTRKQSPGTTARAVRRCSMATSHSIPATGTPVSVSAGSIPTGARCSC